MTVVCNVWVVYELVALFQLKLGAFKQIAKLWDLRRNIAAWAANLLQLHFAARWTMTSCQTLPWMFWFVDDVSFTCRGLINMTNDTDRPLNQ